MKSVLTLLRQLLILIHRHLTTKNKIKNVYLDSEMEKAIQYFNDNYNTEINIEEYAASRGMSVSWKREEHQPPPFVPRTRYSEGDTPFCFLKILSAAPLFHIILKHHARAKENNFFPFAALKHACQLLYVLLIRMLWVVNACVFCMEMSSSDQTTFLPYFIK